MIRNRRRYIYSFVFFILLFNFSFSKIDSDSDTISQLKLIKSEIRNLERVFGTFLERKELGSKKEEQMKALEQKLQEKIDNKFIIADNPTALSRVIKIHGLESDYQSSSNTVKTLIVYGKEPKLKAIVSHNGIKYTVSKGDSIAGGIISIIDGEKLVFVKDGIEYADYFNKKRR